MMAFDGCWQVFTAHDGAGLRLQASLRHFLGGRLQPRRIGSVDEPFRSAPALSRFAAEASHTLCHVRYHLRGAKLAVKPTDIRAYTHIPI